jgi:hypothetical protein
MRHWQILTVGASLFSLIGCAGMSANECELADWQAVGYEDGVQGRSSDKFGSYRKNCAKHEVAPDFQTYQSGREAGLREYCQPTRGFREGSRGAKYVGVCPTDLETDFLESYNDGRTLYELEHAVSSAKRQIDHRKSRMKDIESELAQIMATLLIDDAPGEERAALLVETKQLAEERMSLANEVENLQQQLYESQEELDEHRSQLLTQL